MEEDCVRTFCATVPAPEAAGFLVGFFFTVFVCVCVFWCLGAWAVLSSQRRAVLILDLDLSVLSGETQT